MVCRAAGQASTMLNVASHVAWLALIGRLEKSQCDGGHKMCVLPKRDGAQQYSSGFRHKQRSSIKSTLECTDQAAAMNGASSGKRTSTRFAFGFVV